MSNKWLCLHQYYMYNDTCNNTRREQKMINQAAHGGSRDLKSPPKDLGSDPNCEKDTTKCQNFRHAQPVAKNCSQSDDLHWSWKLFQLILFQSEYKWRQAKHQLPLKSMPVSFTSSTLSMILKLGQQSLQDAEFHITFYFNLKTYQQLVNQATSHPKELSQKNLTWWKNVICFVHMSTICQKMKTWIICCPSVEEFSNTRGRGIVSRLAEQWQTNKARSATKEEASTGTHPVPRPRTTQKPQPLPPKKSWSLFDSGTES